MARRRSLLFVVPVLVAVSASVGCSTIGAPLGITPPAHKLTKQAEELRRESGVAPLPKELNKTLLTPYVVEPGDTLLIIPTRLDSPLRLPGDQPVLMDGTIDLGEFGRPVVAGKTLPDIEADVRRLVAARAKDKDDALLNVRLVGRTSKVFYVLGEVNAPGAFPLAGRETVLDGIIAAGGITRRATTHKIVLSRPTDQCGCRVVLPICYNNIVQIGDTSTNYQLQPGDRIYVPSKGMMEDLFPSKKQKAPCNGPQTLCNMGTSTCCTAPGTGVPNP